MYVCVYVCMCVCSACTHMYTRMRGFTCICIYTCVHKYISVHVYTHNTAPCKERRPFLTPTSSPTESSPEVHVLVPSPADEIRPSPFSNSASQSRTRRRRRSRSRRDRRKTKSRRHRRSERHRSHGAVGAAVAVAEGSCTAAATAACTERGACRWGMREVWKWPFELRGVFICCSMCELLEQS